MVHRVRQHRVRLVKTWTIVVRRITTLAVLAAVAAAALAACGSGTNLDAIASKLYGYPLTKCHQILNGVPAALGKAYDCSTPGGGDGYLMTESPSGTFTAAGNSGSGNTGSGNTGSGNTGSGN